MRFDPVSRSYHLPGKLSLKEGIPGPGAGISVLKLGDRKRNERIARGKFAMKRGGNHRPVHTVRYMREIVASGDKRKES